VPDWGIMAIRALGSMIMLFVLTRILGKKQISQLTFFEYVTGIVIGDLAGYMSTDIRANYMHGATAMLVWFAVPLAAESLAMKSKTLRYWLEGKGTVIIRDGKVLEDNLRKERYTGDELMEQLRTKGVFNPAVVEFAILEASGELSVLMKEEHQALTSHSVGLRPDRKVPPQAVIMDGQILHEGLSFLGFECAWLEGELERLGHTRDRIFLAVADGDGSLYLDFYEDKLPSGKKRRVRRRSR
jgi:uncharacterized membrane protein YcaP (DUF421 family)